MHEHGQQEFQAQTGIDIEHDIDYVVASMTPTGDSAAAGLVVARGRFNVVKLEALVREHGGTVEEYKGKRLITVSPNTNAEQFTMAFLEPGMTSVSALVAVGDAAAVKHAIDAQLTAQSITSNNEMMELVKRHRARQQRVGRWPSRRAHRAGQAARRSRHADSRGEVVRGRRPCQRRLLGDDPRRSA